MKPEVVETRGSKKSTSVAGHRAGAGVRGAGWSVGLGGSQWDTRRWLWPAGLYKTKDTEKGKTELRFACK